MRLLCDNCPDRRANLRRQSSTIPVQLRLILVGPLVHRSSPQGGSAGDDAFTNDVPTLPGEGPEITADAIPEGGAPESLANQAQMDVSIEQLSLLEILTGLILMAGVLFAMPFLAGMENIIGLLIIGFGLYQAWSLNRKTVLRVSGPFRIQADNS